MKEMWKENWGVDTLQLAAEETEGSNLYLPSVCICFTSRNSSYKVVRAKN
jgi:hypothetical protein